MMRPFRFGVQSKSAPEGSTWAVWARRLASWGYATLTCADHFGDEYAPVPALAAAAAATTDLRIGSLVFANDYRHPVVLAKECATLDVLSGGRLEVGVGAGWQSVDYQRTGIPLDAASTRVARLAESIEVLKGLWADGPYTFDGIHYEIAGLDGSPRPVQRPHPRLLVGGGGLRILRLAGAEADIVGINFDLRGGQIDATVGPNGTETATEAKLTAIRDGAGTRYDDLELHVRIHLAMIAPDRRAVADEVAPAFGLSPDEALATPHALVGTVDEICAQLSERRDRWGISYIGISADAAEAFAPVVERLAGR